MVRKKSPGMVSYIIPIHPMGSPKNTRKESTKRTSHERLGVQCMDFPLPRSTNSEQFQVTLQKIQPFSPWLLTTY